MIDIPFLTPLLDRIPTYMDFEGQKVAEKIFQVVIVAFAISAIWGLLNGLDCNCITHHTLFPLLCLVSDLLEMNRWLLESYNSTYLEHADRNSYLHISVTRMWLSSLFITALSGGIPMAAPVMLIAALCMASLCQGKSFVGILLD
ncbi:hypothetical protein HPB52_019413 [Rhipicephalus sanguineus]|uniref:Uncharacterized protein n=1 Tax=Rhipicephalus sanguineus TaxID=34632 RepID=A0A9D4SYZ5_RHISA|nr:hypothetical protein HPB52_019413 [Rhipicephalus sanguineus]